ncbi:unnamed protein product [Adineta steineri]|uniref:Uncharacterized protein n=1 Tax=Adineta steineri TaxID=433720 RepID=A0A814K1K3_9BILA|nr:unnamed protein product [Adineta steineri]CAF1053119.1 unnamed protein product [Adineta steineri]CAF1120368.1 unnamed protein product [Adineta steineri]
MSNSRRPPVKFSEPIFDRTLSTPVYQTSAQQSRTTTQDQIKNVPSGSSATKSKCSASRCIGLELLILLLLLVLAALIIPIVVVVLDNRSSCSTTYSQTFTSGVTTTTQCTAWVAFTNSLTCSSYSLMRIYGSNDPVGITVDSSSVVTAFAQSLRYNFTFGISYNGITWRVGPCGNGGEISATGSLCACGSGYTMRPCYTSPNWGGINSATCGAATQTMSLHFE